MSKIKHKKEFTKELSDTCIYLINKHKSDPKDFESRNELFILLKDWMEIWIKSILSKWYRSERSEIILAFSWDAFYFSLKYYKLGNAVPSHFYNYTRYYLLTYYAERDSVHLSLEELKEVLLLVPSDHHEKFGKLLTLFQLGSIIPKEHKIVWEDSLQSLSSSTKDRQRTFGKIGIGEPAYSHLKKSFIAIINFVLDE